MTSRPRLFQRAISHLGGPVADLPAFLCPGIIRATFGRPAVQQEKPARSNRAWRLITTTCNPSRAYDAAPGLGLDALPQQCAGCGGFSQTVDKNGPGYYTLTRNSIRTYFDKIYGRERASVSEEDKIVAAALENSGMIAKNSNLESSLTPGTETLHVEGKSLVNHTAAYSLEPPLCDRCHQLKHHEIGASIQHPSPKSLQNTVFESPHKYNHVYHVVDAADFPMSFIPGLHRMLQLTPQRAKNRRAKTGRFYHGRKTDVSFIITRSDLLAPTKEQVDSLMPYLRATLRDTLGKDSQSVRLGNIRCVSAKRSWWTKELKEEIWQRGGGGWMVGKVNVGKSQLLHNIFPKGRREKDKLLVKSRVAPAGGVMGEPEGLVAGKESTSPVSDESVEVGIQDKALALALEKEIDAEDEAEALKNENAALDSTSLLPPAQPEVDYPAMPLVSALPGTTASPIRLSYGSGKGELIDLPGLSRGDLEQHVLPEHRSSLVMRDRIIPEQQVIKPGQSLLLGGFIRITPTTPDLIILSYAFTPIEAHLTSTEKAIGTQTRSRESSVLNISVPGTEAKISSAGTFHLQWDVTKQRTGPITRKDAVNTKPDKLPYQVFSTDILIEGCGWVELVAQVSKAKMRAANLTHQRATAHDWDLAERNGNEEINPGWPTVEVFSPEGKFVAARRPLNAWLYIARKPGKTHKRMGRPRKSMKGAKKQEKARRRLLL